MTLKTRDDIVPGFDQRHWSCHRPRALGRRQRDDQRRRGDRSQAGEHAKEFGVTAIYSGAYMTNPDAIHAMVEEAEAKLVNNAGVQHVAPVEEFPHENLDMIIAINLSAAFHAAPPRSRDEGRANWAGFPAPPRPIRA